MGVFGKKNSKVVWIRETHILKSDEYVCSSCGYKSRKPLKTCPGCRAEISGIKNNSSWIDEIEMIDAFLD